MYEKYTYWLSRERFYRLKQALEDQGRSLYETKKTVCLPLAKKVHIGFVPPDIWQSYDLCRRQLSWYTESRYAGMFLVVSDERLDVPDLMPTTVIRKIKFKPPRLPAPRQGHRQALINRPSYIDAAPELWADIDAMDPKLQEKWLKIMGVRGMSYKNLFIYHCANHANFIEPAYYLEDDDGAPVPYAIGKTNQVCSACLEMYNIIGEKFKKKLVVPCPGAALFAGLGVNRYYEVETLNGCC